MTTEQIQLELASLAEELKAYGERIGNLYTAADTIDASADSGHPIAARIANDLASAGGFLLALVSLTESAATVRAEDIESTSQNVTAPHLAKLLARYERAHAEAIQAERESSQKFEQLMKMVAAIVYQARGLPLADNDGGGEK